MAYNPNNPNGQATAANSAPVVIASNQSAVPISAVSLPLPTGAAQDGTDITTPTPMPAGGLGIRGWLSSIWTKLNGSLAVTGTRTNAGTTATAGANHLTVGGSDGTNLRPLLVDTLGRAIITANIKLPVEIAETQSDIHGQLVEVTRITQLVTKFFQQTPANVLNITLVGTGATSSGIGTGIFSTGTGTTASVLAQTPATILYSAQYEAWGVLSGAFTGPTSAASFQRLGPYNTIDGFAFGFNGLVFGLWSRFNSADTFIAQTSWNRDVLNGGVGSTFRSNNLPVALAPTNMNMFRVRYGWYGGVTAYYEVYAPDGNWVLVHQIRTANSQTAVNMTNPNLPLTVEVSKSASDATNLVITCGGWAAGITAPTTGTSMSGQQNIAALNANLILPTTGIASLSFNITNTWVGTLLFQQSLDGIIWNPLLVPDSTGTLVTQTTVNGNFVATVSNQRFNRVIASPWTSGTATIVYHGSSISTERPLLLDATGRQSVIGTFFQATQPVSIVTMPTTPVTGTFFQTTQPVSIAATIPTDPLDRAARLLGVLSAGANAIGNINELRAAPLTVTATGASGAAVTLTIPAVAGQFHYITAITIHIYATAARTGAAAPIVVTTTNIAGAPAFTFETAQAIGTNTPIQALKPSTPLRTAVVNTATTIVAPIATAGIWRITAAYFTGA